MRLKTHEGLLMRHLIENLQDIIRRNHRRIQHRMMYFFWMGVLCMLSSIMSCNSCNQPTPKPQPINIVVILDTSDRIDPDIHRDQITLDKELVESIINVYHSFAKTKLFTNRKDGVTFVVPDQPRTNPIPRDVTRRLKIRPTESEIGANARHEREKAFIKLEKNALNAVNKVYTIVENQNNYTGSDIWNWFRLQCRNHLKSDTRNYIVCISDGYLEFNRRIQERRPSLNNKTSYMRYDLISRLGNDPGWKSVFNDEGHGLLEFEQDFSDYDVKFMMVEMKLRDINLLYEREIIETYWEKWLSSMGITKSKFVYSGANAIDAIEDFLSWDDKQFTKTH